MGPHHEHTSRVVTIRRLAAWSPILALLAGCATTAPLAVSPQMDEAHALGGYSARFRQGEHERNHNIATAAAALDGRVIAPGATFSFNQAVGPRTGKRGYRVAPTLTLDGAEPALGGGVCQVSSVLFNALMQADLELVERTQHSRPIRYIPPGRDATVSWGHLDLRVRNPHPFPVTIRSEVRAHRLTFWVKASEPLDHEVRLVTEQVESASPKRPVEMFGSGEAPPDSQRLEGAYVKLFRERLLDGRVYERERLANTLYLTGVSGARR
ncbi:MAG: hypothetical protein AMXMBFR64_48160 [Myxococcales bacterium]